MHMLLICSKSSVGFDDKAGAGVRAKHVLNLKNLGVDYNRKQLWNISSRDARGMGPNLSIESTDLAVLHSHFIGGIRSANEHMDSIKRN